MRVRLGSQESGPASQGPISCRSTLAEGEVGADLENWKECAGRYRSSCGSCGSFTFSVLAVPMHELSQICHEPAQTRLYYYSIVLFYKTQFISPRDKHIKRYSEKAWKLHIPDLQTWGQRVPSHSARATHIVPLLCYYLSKRLAVLAQTLPSPPCAIEWFMISTDDIMMLAGPTSALRRYKKALRVHTLPLNSHISRDNFYPTKPTTFYQL